MRINAQLLGGQLFFENTSRLPLDDGIIFFWYRVMPHESESYGQRGLSLILKGQLDEGMRDGFGLIFGIVSRCLKLHKNMLFLMEIL